MKIGSLDITDIKRGSIDLEKVYRGEDLVWERKHFEYYFVYASGHSGNTIYKYDTQRNIFDDFVTLNTNKIKVKNDFLYTGGPSVALPLGAGDATVRKYNPVTDALVWGYVSTGEVHCLDVDDSDNVYIAGFQVNSSNVTTRKLNSSGGSVWTADHGAKVNAIKYHNGFVYTGGEPVGGSGGTQYDTTRKYNATTGDLIWTRAHGGINDVARAVNDLCVDNNDNLYTLGVGTSEGTPRMLRKYNSDGDLIWSINTSTYTNCLLYHNDIIYVGGNSGVRKYDTNGDLLGTIDTGSAVNDITATGDKVYVGSSRIDTNRETYGSRSLRIFNSDDELIQSSFHSGKIGGYLGTIYGISGPLRTAEEIFDFEFKIEINVPSNGYTVTYNVNFTESILVDWGDSSTTTYSSGTTISHTYATSGLKVITIGSKTLTRFWGDDVNNRLITKCLDWGNTSWNNMQQMFGVLVGDTGNLTSLPIKAPNIVGVNVTIYRVFTRQDGAVNWNVLEDWDVSNVVLFINVLWSCTQFNADLSGWDVSKGTRHDGFFTECTNFNKDISGWRTPLSTNMNGMFNNCPSFNQDIGNWDVSSVSTMNQMFNGCTSFNQDLSSWCVPLIGTKPTNFDANTPAWNKTNRQPIWGTCP